MKLLLKKHPFLNLLKIHWLQSDEILHQLNRCYQARRCGSRRHCINRLCG
ncbi:hypothetical protein Scep_012867 [Stephania cephalantha]|uniref:Uncharacterized protein n=1 Tax=Stephania cephalantha TaxID=152367 RepID=A0AAP0JG75_9MAGN